MICGALVGRPIYLSLQLQNVLLTYHQVLIYFLLLFLDQHHPLFQLQLVLNQPVDVLLLAYIVALHQTLPLPHTLRYHLLQLYLLLLHHQQLLLQLSHSPSKRPQISIRILVLVSGLRMLLGLLMVGDAGDAPSSLGPGRVG